MSLPEVLTIFLASLASLGGPPVQARDATAIREEWRIRAMALDSESISLVEQAGWTGRLAALEALRRRLESGRRDVLDAKTIEQLSELLADPAPNVRAAALSCLRHAEFLVWEEHLVERLSEDPLPEVRAELCRALPPERWLGQSKALLRLANSSELEVRRAARIALHSLDPGVPEALALQTGFFRELLAEEGGESFLLELETWDRVIRTVPVPAPLIAHDGPVGALRVVLSPETPTRSELALVAQHWTDPVDPKWTSKHRVQREFLLRGARRWKQPLAIELLSVLAETAQKEESLERELLFEDLFEGLVAASSANWALSQLLGIGLSDSELSFFWLSAEVVQVDWNELPLEIWLNESRSAELRVRVADSLARAYTREGQAPLAEHLVGLLHDNQSEIRNLVFLALCNSPSGLTAGLEQHLFDAWRESGRAEQLEHLRRLPRGRALPMFRSALLELGEDLARRHRHPSIVELLGKFEGDVECRLRLVRWLEEDLAAITPNLEQLEAAEVAARGEVRALHDIAGDAAVLPVKVALERSTSSSVEVAKVCAWCLGRSSAGLAALVSSLEPTTPTRVQVEAALALCLRGEPTVADRALGVLLERFETCDGELRSRILGAFAELDARPAREFLLQLWSDEATPIEQLALAIEALSARFDRTRGQAELEDLVRCVRLERGGEAGRLAIEALGRARDARVQALLEARIAPGSPMLRNERDDLLVALARCAPHSDVLWRELWREPMLSAEWRLANRFRGEKSAAIAFAFRGELEALQTIASVGGWRMEQRPLLERLDGRLALALAESCRVGGDVEHAELLERVALIALEGELPDEKTRFAALRVRTRLWRSAELAGREFETAHFSKRILDDWVRRVISGRDLESLFDGAEAGGRSYPALLAASLRRASGALAREHDQR